MRLLTCLTSLFMGFNLMNPLPCPAQHKLIGLNGRNYIDTSWSSAFRPDSIFVYYYNVRGKYPESSESLCSEADAFLKNSHVSAEGNGFISFRFYIDSAGQIQKRVEVLETSDTYQPTRFKEELVFDLFNFLQTLKQWKPAKAPPGYPPFYIGIMTFKIYEGNIVAIIP